MRMHPNSPISFESTCIILGLMVAMAAVDRSIAKIQTMSTASITSKRGCPSKCGNISIPYPFGIGLDSGCSLNSFYDVFCNTSSNPPTPFLVRVFPVGQYPYTNYEEFRHEVFEILDISETKIRIRNPLVVSDCFNGSTSGRDPNSIPSLYHPFPFHQRLLVSPNLPFSFSSTSNKLVVIGCQETGSSGYASCNSKCSRREEVVASQCYGSGCCKAGIPPGAQSIALTLSSPHTNYSESVSFNPCGYAFLAEEGRFSFGGLSDLNDPNFPTRVMETVPVTIDWVIDDRPPCVDSLFRPCDPLAQPSTYGCSDAKRNQSTYACMGNTNCSDQFDSPMGGYKCFCQFGFQGNPYLSPGCSDIDECADPILNTCSMECYNKPGSFDCGCPVGYTGDGKQNGSGCIKNSSQIFLLRLCLGASVGFLFLVTGLSWLYYITNRKRKISQMKKKYFRQNGGWLMEEQLAMANMGGVELSTIFTEEELKASTNNFDKDCIIGTGGYGTVYKGVLLNSQVVVAIKKSKLVDENQIEQFINELLILGQINHRNVVKLLGCCLETEVPLLVYEFISKGTLYSHIHANKDEGETWHLEWRDCLRIASEAADALSYLHSAASPPIIHRDIKSMNILLDDDYTAKIADFGASRLIPMDQTQLPTLVQGTLGYLDPEYLHSGLLTEKSDVYSFGVVLAELLTRQKPFSVFRPEEDRNIATYFVRSVEEEKLFDILDPQWLTEASTLELVAMASITKRCLQLSRRDRPTMGEVAVELEGLVKKLKK